MFAVNTGSTNASKVSWTPTPDDPWVRSPGQTTGQANSGAIKTPDPSYLDTQYNVMGLVARDDATAVFSLGAGATAGSIVERYEYTPYGERAVYISAGADDPLCTAPLVTSQRVIDGTGTALSYGLCTIGHQGLMHDEATGLIQNRARMRHARLGRFLQRDPLGYPDGMSGYAAYHVMMGGVDHTGRLREACVYIRRKDAFNIPGGRFFGASHLAIEIDWIGISKTHLIELNSYNNPRFEPQDRKGYGPLGVSLVASELLMYHRAGLANHGVLRAIDAVSRVTAGMSAIELFHVLDQKGMRDAGAGLLQFYSIWVGIDAVATGERILVGRMPSTDATKLLRAARWIGNRTKNRYFKVPFGPKSFGKFAIGGGSVTMKFGIGYHPLTRNSSSFVGSVFRRAGIPIPTEVSGAIGIDEEFTKWKRWEIRLMEAIQKGAP